MYSSCVLWRVVCAGHALEVGPSVGPTQSFILCAGRALEDGSGVLPDGTQWNRQSGEEFGPNGYWFRWHRLSGKSGKVCHDSAP